MFLRSDAYSRAALADIDPILKGNQDAIQGVADETESLRGMYPLVKVAKSFLESSESVNQKELSLLTLSEREFEFDNIAINSPAYRRVLNAASHTLRKSQSGNILGTGNLSDPGVDEASRQQSSTPIIQSANQARKISNTAPLRTVSSSATEKEPHNDKNRRPTTNSFIEQLRGLLDHAEGELQSANEETMQLRDTIQEKDMAIQKLNSSIKEFKKVERELDLALASAEAEVDELKVQVQKLKAEYSQLEINAKRPEKLVQEGRTTQIGSMILVPYHAPSWINEQNPRIFKAWDIPEAPEGWISRWDGKFLQFPECDWVVN